MERIAIIVVTYVTNDFQRDLLKQSIGSVLKHHPNDTLVILNDNHEATLDDIIPSSRNIMFQKTKHPKCGEVNAYTWACEHVNEFTRFVFIHDSVILHNTIPTNLEVDIHFRPLWYAVPFFSSVGLMNKEVEDVIKDIRIGPTLGPSLYTIILERYIYVDFGCMAIWDRTFCKFIKESTNILEQASRFNTRNLRCLFERIAFICFAYLHSHFPLRKFPSISLCGDIMAHSSPFSNTVIDETLANNPYVLKVWQGR